MQKFISFLKYLILAVIILLQVSCSGDYPCIDADDFGYPKLSISARGDFPCPGADNLGTICGQGSNQVVSWTPANLVLTGDILLISVQNGPSSEWGPWFGLDQNGNSSSDGKVSSLIADAPYCPFYLDDVKAWDINSDMANVSGIAINGCRVNYGRGLYGLIVPDNTNPNASEMTIRNLSSNYSSFHVGHQDPNTANPPFLDGDGNLAGGFCAYPPGVTSGFKGCHTLPANATRGSSLYFKISDSYYADNSGQYSIVIKSGAASTINKSPIATVVSAITTGFSNAAKAIFTNLSNSLIQPVRIILTLYIVFMGVSFAMGMSSLTNKEVFMHLAKMSIVVTVISPGAWDFFNSTFLDLFVGGVQEISCMLAQNMPGGAACDLNSTTTANAASNLTFFDNLMAPFISNETQMKILSLFFQNNGLGIVAVIVIELAIGLYCLMIFKAVIYYLLTYMAITLLIILFPIFIIFILFKLTSEFYKNWMKQVVSYSIQPIMIVASLSLTTQIILSQFHKLLGFKICWQPLINLPLMSTLLKFWQPQKLVIPLVNNVPAQPQAMPIPEAILGPVIDANGNARYDGNIVCRQNPQDTDPSANENCSDVNNLCGVNSQSNSIKCTPNNCYGLRYPGAPFFDASCKASYASTSCSSSSYDLGKINDYQQGHFVSINDVLFFILIIFLMFKFNETAGKIGKLLAGAGNDQTDMSRVASQAEGGYQSAMAAPFEIGDRYLRTHNDDYEAFRQKIEGIKHTVRYAIPDLPGTLIDKIKREGSNMIDPLGGYKRDAEKGEFAKQLKRDEFGRKVDVVGDIKDLVKDQMLYNFSGGLLGKDMNYEATLGYNISALSQIADRYTLAFTPQKDPPLREDGDDDEAYENKLKAFKLEQDTLNEIRGNKVQAELSDMFTGTSSLSSVGKIAVGVAMLNPFVGSMVGAIAATKSGATLFSKYSKISQLDGDDPVARPVVKGD